MSAEGAKQSSKVNDGAHKPGIQQKDMLKYYSQWAESGKYDIDLGPKNYKGPEFCAEEIGQQLKLKNLKIIDVAAGTGFLGKELRKLGYNNLDAMEPSDGMVKILRASNIYQNVFLDAIDDKKITSVQSTEYDALGIAGGMGEGHIPCIGLIHLIEIVKEGGIITIVMRKEYLQTVSEYKQRLEPFMKYLEEKGYWKMTTRKIRKKYSFENDGIVYTFQVLRKDCIDIEEARNTLQSFDNSG